MVTANTEKSGGVRGAHSKIEKLFKNDDKMDASELNTRDVSRIISKMPGRQEPLTIYQTMDTLFEVAAGKMESDKDKEVLANLRKHVYQLEQDLYRPKPRYIDAFFFPNKDNVYRLERYIKKAKKSLWVCVFNLTNDVLANAVKERHEAGVQVRVITDDECMKNKGNDCERLAQAGIPVRTDDAEQYHMHNKFMLVDHEFLLTGSFNWTFQAGSHNQENLLVVDEPYYIEKYGQEFDRLWNQFKVNQCDTPEEKAAVTIQKHHRNKQQKKKNSELKGGSAPGYVFKGW